MPNNNPNRPPTAPETEKPYTEAELDHAIGHLLARMVPLTRRTGFMIEEIIESDLFGLLALAYVAALRANGPVEELDALAFSFYVRMLASAPQGFDRVTDLIVLDSIQWCSPGPDDDTRARALRLVLPQD
ncbi:hypothetical protein [Streptomyces sp. NPDC053720]|uniref:hypothetical protein n=1 Tax=Streptomyces sp. NPDC053720 TaxID=3154855 RepID=UPI003444A9A3